MLTQNQANEIRARIEVYNKWTFQFRGKNKWTVIPAEQAKFAPVQVTNEERGLLELFDFVAEKPDRYFAYVREINGKLGAAPITTWMGDKLGEVIYAGREYRCPAFGGYGSKRINIRVRAITGEVYSGTYYKSSGDYCRLRKVKG